MAWVTFDQTPTASSTFYTGTITLDPNFNKTTAACQCWGVKRLPPS